jgi:hypothetical protein
MINAALHGKLDCLGSEDALTAAVFGRLRYLDPTVLVEWLALARNYSQHGRIITTNTNEPLVEFWPAVKDTLRGKGTVEPDVVINFGIEVMIVEAKLWSPKSRIDEWDQLARQWHGVADHHGARARVTALLYVTSHVELPTAELDESAEALGVHSPNLWWLSWSALGPILERQIESGDRVSRLVAEDLLAYLRRANVLRFHGWRLAVPWGHNEYWRYRTHYWSDYSLQAPVWRYT